jgi:hypothetical protein
MLELAEALEAKAAGIEAQPEKMPPAANDRLLAPDCVRS